MLFVLNSSGCSRDINDPEHPLTLEQLNVVQEELIIVEKNDDETIVDVSIGFSTLSFIINNFS